jgi:hypothetical protein
MVQCYSGQFSAINFVGGDPSKGLSFSNRCGFFSQLPNRKAAGCTPDLNLREEYTPYFLTAISGQKGKDGFPVNADFDQDGKVSSAEAHAYVSIEENSLDVPVSTSSELLRSAHLSIPKTLLTLGWEELKSKMNPIEKAILLGISAKLNFDIEAEKAPTQAITARLKNAQSELQQTLKNANDAQDRLAQLHEKLASTLTRLFPEFSGRRPSPEIWDKLKNAMEQDPLFASFKESYLASVEADAQKAKAERIEAKWMRLSYALETKLLEESLNLLAKSDAAQAEKLQQKYRQLKSCESESFF